MSINYSGYINKQIRPYGTYWSLAALLIVCLFLSLGNLPRVVSVRGFSNNILLTEFVVYFFLFCIATARGLLLKAIVVSFPVIAIILLSFSIGMAKFSYNQPAMFYAIRLSMLYFSGICAGLIFQRVFRFDIIKLSNYFLFTYFLLFLFGLPIFILFPESEAFWFFLKQRGVEFTGDPHVHRYISPYFDPNYFSVIICFPIIICFHLFQETKKIFYILLASVFSLSIFISGSRSGLITLLFSIVISNFKNLNFLKKLYINKKFFIASTIGGAFLLFLIPFYIENLLIILERLTSISDDTSALARWATFNFGFDIFLSNPLLGIGYNYLSLLTEREFGLSSVDSSLLSTLVNFGSILSLFLLIFFLYWAVSTSGRIKKIGGVYKDIYVSTCLYIIFVIAFASQFNNFLYYPFWLFPMVGWCTYFATLPAPYKTNKLNKYPDAQTTLCN